MSARRCVFFRVDGQDYAAEIERVREVIATPTVTTLPQAEPPVLGIFNLRGQIVTAIDGARALGADPARATRRRTLVTNVAGRDVGVVVDAATEVATVAEAELRPADIGGHAGRLAQAIVLRAGRPPAVLLDLASLVEAALPRVVASEVHA